MQTCLVSPRLQFILESLESQKCFKFYFPLQVVIPLYITLLDFDIIINSIFVVDSINIDSYIIFLIKILSKKLQLAAANTNLSDCLLIYDI